MAWGVLAWPGDGKDWLMLRNILKDSLVYGISGAASRFVSVLLVPIYTRIFSPSEYGLIDIINTISAVLIVLSGMQVESGIARSYYESKAEGRNSELVGTGILLYVAGALCWTIIAVGLYQFEFVGYRGITWQVVFPALIIILPSQLMTLGTVLLRFERRAAVYGLITLGDVLTSSLLSILAVYVLHSGISGMLWALALSKIFWSGVCYLPLRGSLRFTLRRAEAKEILAYGLPLVPAVLVGWAQTYANRFVMVSSLSFAEIGIYSLAVKVASGITIVDTAFRLAWDPYAVSIMGDPDARDKYARMLDIYVVVMVGICAVVGALGPVLVKLLSTPAYFMAGRLVGFIAMALLWTGILQILLLGIGVVRKTYLGAFGFSIGVCVNITLLMSTLKANGIIAVCYSYLAGSIVTALIILYIGQRNYYIPYRYSTIFLTILGAIFIAGYNYLFGDIMPGDMTGLLSKSLFNLTVALLLASVMFCLVITKQDKRNVKLYLFSMLNK